MRWLLLAALTAAAIFSPKPILPNGSTAHANLGSTVGAVLDNYDIRADRALPPIEKLRLLRGAGRELARIADTRFKIEFNDDLDVGEIISPAAGRVFLGSSEGRSRSDMLKAFVTNEPQLFGIRDLTQFQLDADYSNPDGNLSFVRFSQKIAGTRVFNAELKAGFSRDGEMFRVVSSFAHNIDQSGVSKDFGKAESAIVKAAANVNVNLTFDEFARAARKDDGKEHFVSAKFTDEIVAEKYYFPIGRGGVRPAWCISLWVVDAAYLVVVDAEDGTLLWRKNIVERQTRPATFEVYGSQTALMRTADSPSPFSPGCLSPTGCSQPAAIARTTFTLIGNEPPYSFNSTGWIPDDGLPVRTPALSNITDGNNVETGIDRAAPNGVDDNGWAFGTPTTRVFGYAYNPGPGNPPPGEEPLPTTQTYPPSQFQQGAITHGFYLANRWHDEMYRFGFTESARNFQHLNFGRGGAEGDRISFEIQDFSSTNGANFAVPPDGQRPRLQMFVWSGPTPDRDGALDSQTVVHELTHGVSNRLIGNATGLSSNMARALGEGWSDFYSLALLAEPSDDRFGTYAVSGYVTYLILPNYESNYYYGIRRFPVAVLNSRGPNGLPHNPLTFRYLNAGCSTLIGTDTSNPNSAYPRGPIGASSQCDQVHNMGELWAVTLWEARDQLIQRRGAAEGNRRILQYVTDGMKLSPLNPTILQARDAILAAASVSDSTDVGPLWRGFAKRGLGENASIQNTGTGNNNTIVTESYEIPTQFGRPTRVDFDGDGRSDISVFRPSDGIWYLNRSTSGFSALNWGISTDIPIPDDFDGDGKADIAVFRATADGSQPDYYILSSATFTVTYASFGLPGDTPLSEDFDGDNKADLCIYRSDGNFWIRKSSDGGVIAVPILGGGIPFAADFDGDGRGDLGTFINGTWALRLSTGNYEVESIQVWGASGDKPVPADYDGNGRDDLAVYRPSIGTWLIRGGATVPFGIATDTPVPADYDGDGRSEVAVYRGGIWWIYSTTSGVTVARFGLENDKPLQATLIP
ncbi:MAG TPA: M36 family metallopeptidase [Pyrinomonadaceae bacterium]|nr:M36 family metallopeptidase [Pyrinomonadaceae bacterium]